MRRATLLFLSMFLVFFAAACRDEPANITYYDDEGDVLKTETVEPGETPSFPEVTKEGYIFLGWFKDVDSYDRIHEESSLSGDVDLYPRFESEATLNPYREHFDDDNPVVTIKVEGYAPMKIELFPEVAPNTVKNMIHLIEEGYYDGSTFHRVIENFMIQGGSGESLDCKIEGEFSSNGIDNPLEHTRGVISMARVSGDYNSATSQFFIMHQDSSHLDGEYASYGAMIEGFDVLDAIATVDTQNEAPRRTVRIASVSVDTKGVDYDPPTCYAD